MHYDDHDYPDEFNLTRRLIPCLWLWWMVRLMAAVTVLTAVVMGAMGWL